MKRSGLALMTALIFLGMAGSVSAEEMKQDPAASVEEDVRQDQTGSVPEEAADQEASLPEAQDGEQESEWNVLFYLCGTDLESRLAAASFNLKEIADTIPGDGVNFLIETGGTKGWQSEYLLGFEIANDRLQRWSYRDEGFVLEDELEDASMSHSDTLADFIRWAAEKYPAKKNMLILWDHGGGSNVGLITDENYGGTTMPLYSLENALQNGGTHFDLVLIDACMMASLEMGQALAPYADYMAGSEETLAANGTDYKSWVQYLYDRPECSAVQLGKRICDSTQQYFTEMGQKSAVESFTMSLTDLSGIGEVAEKFNTFMRNVADLVPDPEAFYEYARDTYYTENYQSEAMHDIFDLSRRAEKAGIDKSVTHELQDAVENAVLYNLRSENHEFSHGLSFYYSLNDDQSTLDHYARTCKNAEYLAFLDSINMNWEAPAWVYEVAEKHPELNRRDYMVVPALIRSEEDSEPLLSLLSGEEAAVYLSYALYYMDWDSKVTYTLGESGSVIPVTDEENGTHMYKAGFDGTWPTLDGKPLCMTIADETESYILYNVPVGLNDNINQLRILINYEDQDQEGDGGVSDDDYDADDDDDPDDDNASDDGNASDDDSDSASDDGLFDDIFDDIFDDSLDDDSVSDNDANDDTNVGNADEDDDLIGDEDDISADDPADEADDADDASGEDTGSEDDGQAESPVHNKVDGSLQVLGIWDGYDSHTGLPGRNIIPADQMDGQYLEFYNAVYSQRFNDISDYTFSTSVEFPDEMDITREKLPKGEYVIRFVVRDVFNTPHYSDGFYVDYDNGRLHY